MDRRLFLQMVSSQLILGLMPAAKVLAAVNPTDWGNDSWEGFFVSIHFDGAWDVSLSLDPWTKAARPSETDMFIEYTPDGMIKLDSGILVGPAMEPMKSHAKDFSIVNGIFMSPNDNGHGALKDFAFSGDSHGNYGALAVEVSQSIAPTLFGVISNDSELSTGNKNPKIEEISQAANLFNSGVDSDLLALAKTSKDGILSQVKAADAYSQNLKRAQSISMNLQKDFSDQKSSDAISIASAFASGVARTAHLRPSSNGNLDTHSDHPKNHLAAQTAVWDQLNSLFNIFKKIEFKNGQSLFDWTTFYVTSEFSRTPALNASKGKDHNPWTNSALLAGRGIQGGKVFGGSRLIPKSQSTHGTSYVVGLPVDLASGRIIESRGDTASSTVINPQNLIKTLIKSMDLNEAALGEGLNKVQALNSVLKKQT